MLREDVIAVSFRLLAVYVAVSLIFGIPEVIQGLSLSVSVLDVVIIVSGMVLLVLLCAVLWHFPLSFAGIFSPRLTSTHSGVKRHEGEGGWEIAGIQLIGLWFFIQSSGDFIYWGFLLVGEWSDIIRRGLLRSDVFLLAGVALLKLMVSFVIIVWARALSKWIRVVTR